MARKGRKVNGFKIMIPMKPWFAGEIDRLIFYATGYMFNWRRQRWTLGGL